MSAMNGYKHPEPTQGKNNVGMRPYDLSDIPFIIAGVQEFVPQLPNYKDITIAPDRVDYLLRHNHTNSANFQAWVLVDKETGQLVGGVGGYCVPGMLTWDLVANDAFLFVLPNWRSLKNLLMLMHAYKTWAMARGAKLITASYMGGWRPEAMAKVMERQGYIKAGDLWMLRLDEAYLNRA